MPKITYIEPGGNERVVDVPVGNSVMEGARDAGVVGIPGECGGACSCSTCHIYVDSAWGDRLSPMGNQEEDMLDFAPEMDPERSRLGCQIRVCAELDGMMVAVPKQQA
jgi:2Fe-2S ferredoxin